MLPREMLFNYAEMSKSGESFGAVTTNNFAIQGVCVIMNSLYGKAGDLEDGEKAIANRIRQL